MDRSPGASTVVSVAMVEESGAVTAAELVTVEAESEAGVLALWTAESNVRVGIGWRR